MGHKIVDTVLAAIKSITCCQELPSYDVDLITTTFFITMSRWQLMLAINIHHVMFCIISTFIFFPVKVQSVLEKSSFFFVFCFWENGEVKFNKQPGPKKGSSINVTEQGEFSLSLPPGPPTPPQHIYRKHSRSSF